LLLPVIQTIIFFGAEIFNTQKKKSAKIKCHLFRPKPQKFHTAEITGEMKLDIPVHYQMGNPLQQGR
jgi:hypothetical protein